MTEVLSFLNKPVSFRGAVYLNDFEAFSVVTCY